MEFEMEEIVEEDEGNHDDDEVMFEATDHPVDDKNSPQTRFNVMQNLFSTSMPANMDKASAVIRDMTEALRSGNIVVFNKCEELLLAQFQDEEAGRYESD